MQRWDREKDINKIYGEQPWTEAHEDNIRILRKRVQLLTWSKVAFINLLIIYIRCKSESVILQAK